MSFKEGLYKVEFSTPLGTGAGVALLERGQVRGGDSLMYYFGTYAVNGDVFTASVRSKAHSSTPGFVPVLGKSDATLDINGRFDASGQGTFNATSPQAPNVKLQAKMTLLVA